MLPRSHRLSKQRDVERVSQMGRPVFAPHLTIRAVPNRIGRPRATVVAGLKVSKRSNVRNRVKRLVREVIRRHLPSIRTDADVVIYVKPHAVGKHYRELADEVGRALDRARLLRGPWVDKGVKSKK
ncbi:ribonuclease P protein component [Candidatus Uhrbacteria bacterium]|nr:ribonuclease P protein component [Candidatus Uhrbacteria bacterium]